MDAWRYHPVVGSTNDIAREWAKAGAPEWGLVIADRQTKGRGRSNRQWVTRGGAGLAFSLVMKPTQEERIVLPRFTALAALGLIRSLSKYNAAAEIKWPNDVLLNGKKLAGVLVEAEWQEEELQALVVGMGVNVGRKAVPPPDGLRYPATSVEEAIGIPVNRWELLASVIQEIHALRPVLATPD
ncbi:MAG: biotin--[acetyl-CoA-carboxylase] ligase, partial [Bacteroidota bacterium]